MLKVLIVDDSSTARASLRAALESDAEIQVVAEAVDGAEALHQIARSRIDLVTMDVHLGRESGLDVAAKIMETSPRPILVVTGVNADDPDLAFRAVEVGALEIRPKLPSPRTSSYEGERRRLIRTVKALAQVPVITRRSGRRRRLEGKTRPLSKTEKGRVGAVVMGASTGGPPVLQSLLRSFTDQLSCPIVIVQHIFEGFAQGLALWLSGTVPHPVMVCEEDLVPEAGVVYLAPGGHHLHFRSESILGPSDDSPRRHHRPSVDVLFESAARHLGKESIGVLLTGMGSDGSEGLARMHEEGSTTIVQKLTTCTVDSMPRSALAREASHLELSPEEIVREIERRISGGS